MNNDQKAGLSMALFFGGFALIIAGVIGLGAYLVWQIVSRLL